MAGVASCDRLQFAYRPLQGRGRSAPRWAPADLPGGRLAAFHGRWDNRREIAAELGLPLSDLALLYGHAVDRWGAQADGRIIGEYCALIAEPGAYRLRLSRSPLRAPPLHYHASAAMAAASSVPRALFAAGVRQEIDEAHLADTALYNFSREEETWFREIARVPLGSVVELERGTARKLRSYYDVLAVPKVQMASDADYIARAGELLDEGIRATLDGCRRPGATLSGGLDSPQVAARTLAQLAPGQKLPTFTFHPEPGWDGVSEGGTCGDERGFVTEFAAMHPGIEPHFTDNAGIGHDHRWNELFHLMGGAPPGMTNMYPFHGIWSLARNQGCDALLISEWGNYTFSDNGRAAFAEFFVRGKWRQLLKALSRSGNDPRSLLRRFAADTLTAFLPNSAWEVMKRIWHPGERSALDMVCVLTPEFRASSGAVRRARHMGHLFDRYQPRNRRQTLRELFYNADSESAEIYQAFEQLYGVPQRDPMAYRPFAEFCFGMPVEMFLRDGEMRWLAKQMGKGMMPEAQRANLLNGRWDADWHLRIGRKRDEYLAELQTIARDERLSAMIDAPRLAQALEQFPERTSTDRQELFPLEFGVPRALLAARFVNFVERRNQP